MKRIILIVTLVLSLTNCEKNISQPSSNQIVLRPNNTRTSIQSLKYNPQLFGHQKSIYVPISYYQPITDLSPVYLSGFLEVLIDYILFTTALTKYSPFGIL